MAIGSAYHEANANRHRCHIGGSHVTRRGDLLAIWIRPPPIRQSHVRKRLADVRAACIKPRYGSGGGGGGAGASDYARCYMNLLIRKQRDLIGRAR